MSQFHETSLKGTVADAARRVEAALKERKFGVLHIHDVTATLNSKGVPFPTPMVIMDICNPVYAKQALDATRNRIAPLLPCSVALWQEGDSVIVRYLRPTALAGFFPESPQLVETAVTVASEFEAAFASLAV